MRCVTLFTNLSPYTLLLRQPDISSYYKTDHQYTLYSIPLSLVYYSNDLRTRLGSLHPLKISDRSRPLIMRESRRSSLVWTVVGLKLGYSLSYLNTTNFGDVNITKQRRYPLLMLLVSTTLSKWLNTNT